MNIYGNRVVLRAMEESDTNLIVNMFNDPEIERLVVGWAFPVSAFAHREWFKNHHNDPNDKRFVIEIDKSTSVGIVVLNKIDWKNRRANHGIKIMNATDRGKGIGTDAVMAIMRYAFDELNLVRLDSAWLPDNKPSRALYKKCGWIEEGVRKKYIYKNGEYKDLIISGILADDYYSLIKKNRYWG